MAERCETCLYNKNCQLLVRRGAKNVTSCTAYKGEIVFCKDCVHYMPYKKPVEDFDGRCSACRGETDENEFCNRGKRKDQ